MTAERKRFFTPIEVGKLMFNDKCLFIHRVVGNDYFQLDVASTICDVYVYSEKLTDVIETHQTVWYLVHQLGT